MTNCFQESASVGLGALLILCLTVITVPEQRKLAKRMNDAGLHTTVDAKVGNEIMELDKTISRDLLNEMEAIPALAVVKVSMRNMKFSPRTLNIKKGTVVEWKNDDLVAHTVTSAAFDSGSIGPGKSWRHTFTTAGQFPYTCTFHPTMTGVVVVK